MEGGSIRSINSCCFLSQKIEVLDELQSRRLNPVEAQILKVTGSSFSLNSNFKKFIKPFQAISDNNNNSNKNNSSISKRRNFREVKKAFDV